VLVARRHIASFWPDGSTSPGNYGWIFVFLLSFPVSLYVFFFSFFVIYVHIHVFTYFTHVCLRLKASFFDHLICLRISLPATSFTFVLNSKLHILLFCLYCLFAYFLLILVSLFLSFSIFV
jgi:hypothetical protein